jgi:hypothetical protein
MERHDFSSSAWRPPAGFLKCAHTSRVRGRRSIARLPQGYDHLALQPIDRTLWPLIRNLARMRPFVKNLFVKNPLSRTMEPGLGTRFRGPALGSRGPAPRSRGPEHGSEVRRSGAGVRRRGAGVRNTVPRSGAREPGSGAAEPGSGTRFRGPAPGSRGPALRSRGPEHGSGRRRGGAGARNNHAGRRHIIPRREFPLRLMRRV